MGIQFLNRIVPFSRLASEFIFLGNIEKLALRIIMQIYTTKFPRLNHFLIKLRATLLKNLGFSSFCCHTLYSAFISIFSETETVKGQDRRNVMITEPKRVFRFISRELDFNNFLYFYD